VSEKTDDSLPLAELAYWRLRGDIISCRLQPGQHITERGLAKQTGLGVSPVRDALTRLDHDGLVRTIPRKGYQVAPLTLKIVDDLFTFWQIIGPEVVRQGVIAASDEQLEKIVRRLNEMEIMDSPRINSHQLLRFVELGNDSFTTLAEASGNSYLASAYVRLSGELFRVWTLISDSDSITSAQLMNVTDWSDVIHRRDSESLAKGASEFIQACSDHVAKTLFRWPSVMMSEVVPLRT
jgi:DNA-binding GntR family transcriptional regulator